MPSLSPHPARRLMSRAGRVPLRCSARLPLSPSTRYGRRSGLITLRRPDLSAPGTLAPQLAWRYHVRSHNRHPFTSTGVQMPVTFKSLTPGLTYSRNDLARTWGYKSFHAIARGIVTPQADNKIIIFITEEKQASARQYQDKLDGNILMIEGPDDHFAENRIANAASAGDEIHIFHRKRHHADFTYLGKATLSKLVRNARAPSYFEYKL